MCQLENYLILKKKANSIAIGTLFNFLIDTLIYSIKVLTSSKFKPP